MSSIRQLAAIVFTDIVGYTALMGRDEQNAFELLNKNRQIQRPVIEQFNGRWIKELGDGVMASFSTVSDAVNAAVIIQQKCNAGKEFRLRIGIHLSEVVVENGDVFGDGVNIASRIQAIANPGSIYISEAVNNNLSNKKEFQTRFIKEERLKNVKDPIKIYEVITEGLAPAPREIAQSYKWKKKALIFGLISLLFASGYFIINRPSRKDHKTNEKSIAILPFADLSPERDHEYLADGLADEIINSITIIKGLKVIGRTSSFQYKGKGLDARTIGQRLNVNNVLEGSVQKSGNILRIITKLINVTNDSTIWSQRFDKEVKDIFSIQDSIANNIVEKLSITLSDWERPRLMKKETDQEVYSLYLKGLHTYKKEDFDKSIEYNRKAIEMDSLFAPSYAYIALAKIWKISRTNAISDFNAIREAKEYANESIRLEPQLAEGYSALALLAWTIELDFYTAKLHFEKSVLLNPSASLIKNRYAYFLLWMGDFDKAESLGLDAIGSDPADYNGYVIASNANIYKNKFSNAEKYIAEGQKLFPDNAGFKSLFIASKFYSGNYEQVVQAIKPSFISDPKSISDNQFSFLCISYIKTGNLEESKNILRQFKEKIPAKNSSVYYNIARMYSQYELIDSCFLYLEKSFVKREPDFKLLKIDPLFVDIRKDQRFQQLYHKYGFDRYK